MFKDTKEGTTHFFGDGCKPPHRCPKGTCKRSVYGVCKVCNVGMPPTKTPSPSGEKHGPHAARFVKGLEKSAQDVFESVTQEKTALMVNMDTSPVEEGWEKEFDERGFIIFPCPECDGLGKHIDLSRTVGNRPCSTCFGKCAEPRSNDELKSFIRSAISRARKEERELCEKE